MVFRLQKYIKNPDMQVFSAIFNALSHLSPFTSKRTLLTSKC